MNDANAGCGLGSIDVHVHLSLNGRSSPDGWSRRRWMMRPFLAAAAHDIGLRGGFGARDFDEQYRDRLVRWLEDSSLYGMDKCHDQGLYLASKPYTSRPIVIELVLE